MHEVYEDGAAFKDGRLVAGDQIIKVNILLNRHFISATSFSFSGRID